MDKILEELNNTLSSITDKNREECFNKLKEQRCGCNYPTVDEFLKHSNMEYFKGTKGKWEAVNSSVMSNDVQIADIYCSRECSVSEMNDMDINEMLANTKLIATAPELLAVLLRVMSTYRVRVSMPSDLIEECEEVINKALSNNK